MDYVWLGHHFSSVLFTTILEIYFGSISLGTRYFWGWTDPKCETEVDLCHLNFLFFRKAKRSCWLKQQSFLSFPSKFPPQKPTEVTQWWHQKNQIRTHFVRLTGVPLFTSCPRICVKGGKIEKKEKLFLKRDGEMIVDDLAYFLWTSL